MFSFFLGGRLVYFSLQLFPHIFPFVIFFTDQFICSCRFSLTCFAAVSLLGQWFNFLSYLPATEFFSSFLILFWYPVSRRFINLKPFIYSFLIIRIHNFIYLTYTISLCESVVHLDLFWLCIFFTLFTTWISFPSSTYSLSFNVLLCANFLYLSTLTKQDLRVLSSRFPLFSKFYNAALTFSFFPLSVSSFFLTFFPVTSFS